MEFDPYLAQGISGEECKVIKFDTILFDLSPSKSGKEWKIELWNMDNVAQ